MKDNSKLLGCREGTALTSLDNVLRRGARLAAGPGGWTMPSVWDMLIASGLWADISVCNEQWAVRV